MRPAVNYLRVPVGVSALLLLVFFPLILSRSTGKLEQVSDAPAPDYLARWLLISGALCAGSAVLYLVRSRRVAAKLPPGAARRPTRASSIVSTSRRSGSSAVSGRARPGGRAAPRRCGPAHRHAGEDARIGAREPDRPVAAVQRGAEDGVRAVGETARARRRAGRA